MHRNIWAILKLFRGETCTGLDTMMSKVPALAVSQSHPQVTMPTLSHKKDTLFFMHLSKHRTLTLFHLSKPWIFGTLDPFDPPDDGLMSCEGVVPPRPDRTEPHRGRGPSNGSPMLLGLPDSTKLLQRSRAPPELARWVGGCLARWVAVCRAPPGTICGTVMIY